MNDQLLCGMSIGSIGVLAVAAGFPWLATALFAAAIPFLAIGAAFALGTRAQQDRTATLS